MCAVAKTPDFTKIKEDFPMLKKTMHGKPLIYFDSAATAQKPQSVIDAIQGFYREHYATVHRAIYELSSESTALYNQARKKVKDFIQADKDEEIIFTRGATDSINLVAYSFGKAFFHPGDEILISEIEHHSNIVPWQIMCEDRGAVLKIIPVDDNGDLDLTAYARLLNEKTKLVSIAHVSNSLGTISPIKQMIKMAHEAGSKVLIDACQSVPHIPINVQDLDADFLVFSGHKLYGPTGIGILYGKAELLDAMPPYQGGGDMIETVDFAKTTFNTPPLKFEAGTPIIAGAIGLGAAIDYIQEIGLDTIEKWEQELLKYATEKLKHIEGLRIIGTSKNKSAIISFVVNGIHPLDIGTLLDLRGIAIRTGHHCAQPTMRRFGVPFTARASFAFYNSKEEIDIFVAALKETISMLS